MTVTVQVALKSPSAEVIVIIADPGDTAWTTPLLSTVATFVSPDEKETSLLVASSGKTVYSRDAFSPTTRTSAQLFILRPVTGTYLAFTVTSQTAVFEPSVVFTVIVTFPGLRAETVPSEVTVATASSEDDHFTDLSVASSGDTEALITTVSPSVSSRLFLSTVTPVTLIVLEVTVTEQVAVLEPSTVVTVIVAEPAFTAVTLPLLSTEAVEASEDFQLTVLLVALEGATVAVRVSEPPSTRLRLVLLRVTPVTATVVGTVWPLPPGVSGSSGPQDIIVMGNNAAAKAAIAVLSSFFILITN